MKTFKLNRTRKHFIALIGLCTVLFHAPPLWAQNTDLDPLPDISQYSHRVWKKKNGLPQNSVHAILQTQDKYLWLGTEEGLARFNGFEFTVFNIDNSSISNNIVWKLCESKDSTLWLATPAGVSSFKNGTFVNYTTENGLPSNSIQYLMEDSKLRLWIATDRGLCFFENGVIVKVTAEWQDSFIITLAETKNGEILIGTRKGLYIYSNGTVQLYPSRETKTGTIRALWVEQDGSFLAGLARQGIIHLGDSTKKKPSFLRGPFSDVNWAMLRDRKGTLWVATMNGLVRRVENTITQFTSADGLLGDDIRSIYEDGEGTLWVGTFGGGLNALSRGKFITYMTGKTPNENLVYTISEDESNSLWAGNAAGQVLKFEKGRFVPQRGFERIANLPVHTILHDPATGLWVGTLKGLYRFRNGNLETISLKGDTAESVRAVYKGGNGSIWIAARNGLYRFANNSFEVFGKKDGMFTENIKSLKEDRNGTLWIGTHDGLMKLSGGVFTAVIVSQDSLPKRLGPVYEDAEGVLWVASLGGGLRRIKDGKIVTLTKAHGLFDNTIYEILDDGIGNLWMSSNNGVFSISLSELNRVADAGAGSFVCKPYNEADGMKDSECNGGVQPAGWKTQDGKLWFPTIMGVVMVDPRSLPMNTTIPNVIIENVLVEREPILAVNGVRIPPGKNDIEFQFACLSFKSPDKVRYKYQLRGYDNQWIEAGTRRFALYNNLSPGEYSFSVIASNDDGVWNETGANLLLVIEPFFYQTTVFYALCGVVLFLMGITGVLWYDKEHERKLTTARLHSQVAEANLHALRMQLQPHFMFNTLNGITALISKNPKAAKEMIARLAGLLRLTLENDMGQEVNLGKELQILRRYLEIEQTRFGDRLVVTYNIQRDTDDALVPAFIFQPLVENSIRHGLGKKRGQALIEIKSERENGFLKLSVRDNGAGFEAHDEREAAQGIGLTNTRARLNLLYGGEHTFEISKIDAGGVEVRISIPFKIQRGNSADE